MKIRSIATLLSYAILLTALGCASAASHRAAVSDDNTGRLTVGTVQKEIRVGMSGADVASVLGSPNVVTTDEERREVWIYDKISTERAYSSSSGGVAALVFAGGASVAGGGGASYSASSGASSTTQKTLTVIIKFDSEGLVRDFAYHSSKF
ncbi:MAG TPA: hypothetical protein PLY90_04215 [Candidatus Hydrogenedentes bacterium]|jgi:outer membrane protein assembly factor BamE (lipoprotein component of BamABCDE complex)|nr:MAG: hypothetical protein BWY07_02106 [Candidatus Hydrogenedentes bacterium ADurb.Bin170]HNZ49141.1 hypothetical protein [Candidatus Hydrogenedentota bacterium]HOD96178.1 hypothetical protein [Candidatus Hydrogenedentota bacterium]HOR51825.1 hypothetical protein [Candidatus Hydrogenedentota bacterium]HPK25751.1 hypothetical protein [Candidatus Hydrogenedentota bacterium]